MKQHCEASPNMGMNIFLTWLLVYAGGVFFEAAITKAWASKRIAVPGYFLEVSHSK